MDAIDAALAHVVIVVTLSVGENGFDAVENIKMLWIVFQTVW